MKWFLKMVETARIKGVNHSGNENNNALALKRFNEAVVQAESFVFTSGTSSDEITPEEDVEAAPFESFCFERAHDKFLYTIELDKGRRMGSIALLARETSPNEYDFFHLVCEVNSPSYVVLYEAKGIGRDLSVKKSQGLVNQYINLIHKETEGVEKVKQTFKIGPKADRQKRTIRRVIHIAPKKDYGEVVSAHGGAINWSHRFLVRGHWRKVDGLGKNRNGDYCIQNKTFVIPYEKGQGDLVHKTRIV